MAQEHKEPITLQPHRRDWCLPFAVYVAGMFCGDFLLSAHALGPHEAKEYLKKKLLTKAETGEDRGYPFRPGIPFIPGVSEISFSKLESHHLVKMLAPKHPHRFTNTKGQRFDTLEALVDGSHMVATSDVKLIQITHFWDGNSLIVCE